MKEEEKKHITELIKNTIYEAEEWMKDSEHIHLIKQDPKHLEALARDTTEQIEFVLRRKK